MNRDFHRMLMALREPESMTALSVADWDALLRHARGAGLLSRLALDIQACQGWEMVPVRVRCHMRASSFVAERQIRAVEWEVHKVHEALGHLDIPIVLLKGAAYVMDRLPPARGRLFGDIDLLLPRGQLEQAERILGFHGWQGGTEDEYDQRYYREWMHEIPPLTHITRGSTLDVHHNILPLTARLKPRAEDLFAELRPISGYRNLYRLGDADLVLHSAAHLFHEGEWNNGLRDLVDLDALLRHFGTRPTFWAELDRRADILSLRTPMLHALECAQTLLGTPIGETKARDGRSPPRKRLMCPVYKQGFASAHPDMQGPFAGLALFFLYLRSHWLKMPPRLLFPHLAHKALVRLRKDEKIVVE